MKINPKSTFFFILIDILLFILFTSSGYANSDLWYRSGANDESTKYSAVDQINPSNIGNLNIAWTYNSGYTPPRRNTVQTNPIFTGENLVVTTLDGRVIALDPVNGKLIWQKYFVAPVGRRGITYSSDRLYIPTGSGIYMLSAKTGDTLGVFGSELSFLPPVITKEIILSADLVSGISAYSLATSKKLWGFSLQKDGVLARLWSGFSYDKKSNLVFVVTSDTGHSNSDFNKSGGYANSILAIDASNGRLAWQFQEIGNDLWDLDMVGPPMLVNLNIDGVSVACVVAVSKSGNTLILDRQSGKLLSKSLSKVVEGVRYLNIVNPKPFSSTIFTSKDVTDLSENKKDYVLHKIRDANLTQYQQASFKKPIVLFGLHGGAEWPGATVDPINGVMVVPSNKYPWIMRRNMSNDSSIEPSKFFGDNDQYKSKCSFCHQANLTGLSQDERQGDSYIPSLIGITLKLNKTNFSSVELFKLNHKYAWHQLKSYILEKEKGQPVDETKMIVRLLKKIQRIFNASFLQGAITTLSHSNENLYITPRFSEHELDEISTEDLSSIYAKFKKIDSEIVANGKLRESTSWQLLLDPDLLPGSKPPWGLLTAINLNTGDKIWQIPFGQEEDAKAMIDIPGGRNFGGAMITKPGIIFANGTTDGYARAFDLSSGHELWKSKLPFAGSSPPMTYKYKGCQYVVFTATGGQFVGFGKLGDATVAYKLNSCIN